MKTELYNARLGAEDRYVCVVAEEGRITAVLPRGETTGASRRIDAEGARLFPGLIDIHSHGCVGYDTMEVGHLAEMGAYYLQNGITTWYPTTMTAPREAIAAVLAQEIPQDPEIARIPGYHLEGPYLSESHRGAQNALYIRDPDREEVAAWQHVALLTLAPERPGGEELIRYCHAKGIRVALGHTGCDYAQACAAFAAGADCLTHTCNAMPPLLHRAPGPIGAAIDSNAYAQVICDGLHIARSMITVLYRSFGAGRMILISDSMQSTGLGDGDYIFGEQPVTVRSGVARTAEGALAGSTTNLFGCVQKAISFGIPPADAFRMASETPAAMMGLRKGRIEAGYAAEFVLVDDAYCLLRTLLL